MTAIAIIRNTFAGRVCTLLFLGGLISTWFITVIISSPSILRSAQLIFFAAYFLVFLNFFPEFVEDIGPL
ncbi:hypothetical protein [Candidatus Electronema sp. JM]|uniref:hypothetical protein n=1 Tax=Candidatus Electronema sp. JM TaxID=3401571 RepID=UPI003AA821D2